MKKDAILCFHFLKTKEKKFFLLDFELFFPWWKWRIITNQFGYLLGIWRASKQSKRTVIFLIYWIIAVFRWWNNNEKFFFFLFSLFFLVALEEWLYAWFYYLWSFLSIPTHVLHLFLMLNQQVIIPNADFLHANNHPFTFNYHRHISLPISIPNLWFYNKTILCYDLVCKRKLFLFTERFSCKWKHSHC